MSNIPGILGGNFTVWIFFGTLYIVGAGALPSVHSGIFVRVLFSRSFVKKKTREMPKSLCRLLIYVNHGLVANF